MGTNRETTLSKYSIADKGKLRDAHILNYPFILAMKYIYVEVNNIFYFHVLVNTVPDFIQDYTPPYRMRQHN